MRAHRSAHFAPGCLGNGDLPIDDHPVAPEDDEEDDKVWPGSCRGRSTDLSSIAPGRPVLAARCFPDVALSPAFRAEFLSSNSGRVNE